MTDRIENEIERVKDGYWKLHSSGLPIPRFLYEQLTTDARAERFGAWFINANEKRFIIFYLEAMYRKEGIASWSDIQGWCKDLKHPEKISSEIRASAKLIDEEYSEAVDLYANEKLLMKVRAPVDEDLSDHDRFEKELLMKKFPVGRKANIRLMRKILNIQLGRIDS